MRYYSRNDTPRLIDIWAVNVLSKLLHIRPARYSSTTRICTVCCISANIYPTATAKATPPPLVLPIGTTPAPQLHTDFTSYHSRHGADGDVTVISHFRSAARRRVLLPLSHDSRIRCHTACRRAISGDLITGLGKASRVRFARTQTTSSYISFLTALTFRQFHFSTVLIGKDRHGQSYASPRAHPRLELQTDRY